MSGLDSRYPRTVPVNDTEDDTFNYTVSDGNGGFSTTTVTLTATEVGLEARVDGPNTGGAP